MKLSSFFLHATQTSFFGLCASRLIANEFEDNQTVANIALKMAEILSEATVVFGIPAMITLIKDFMETFNIGLEPNESFEANMVLNNL